MKRWEHQIETVERRNWAQIPMSYTREADFILDLTTFKVLKHRYGGAYDVNPGQAAQWLSAYLEMPDVRILLLTG